MEGPGASHQGGLTAQEGHSPEGLLHEDLGDRGEVMVRVVRHHDAREQDGHDAWRGTEGHRHERQNSTCHGAPESGDTLLQAPEPGARGL